MFQKFGIFTIVNMRRFGIRRNTALFIDIDLVPLGIVCVLSSTLVTFKRTGFPMAKNSWCANSVSGNALIRFTFNLASINLNRIVEVASVFIRNKAF
jgi:hypothetical protein